MANSNIQQEQSPLFIKTPSNNSIKFVSEILKHTNQLIQKGDLDRAQGELLLANRAAKEQYRKSTITSPINEKFVAPQTSLAPLPLAPMEAMMATISSQERVNDVLPQTTKQISKIPSEKSKVPQSEQTNNRDIEINCYREALAEAWNDGALTQDEERRLQELRSVLLILDAEHENFEKEIKHTCYKEAVSRYLSNDAAKLTDGKTLAELQKVFHISQEEHLQIQKFFMQTTQLKQHDKILIIDDDSQFLNMLSISMAEDGFNVTAVATSDEAYTLLQGHMYDLILCDVNLKTSTMNGFVFYEKVQGNKQLQHIPFLFLTGLRDEKLACTGKELGADDYLMKPIPRDTLLSALHGRIKRFRQLRELPKYPAVAALG